MPYLSWTPTVGRNSAFVDLTEEQREELGGIEYRSLKLLAIILVCKLHTISVLCYITDAGHSLLRWLPSSGHDLLAALDCERQILQLGSFRCWS
jgi:hypothetical protein